MRATRIWALAVAFSALFFVLFGLFGVSIGSEDDLTEAFRAVCRASGVAK